MLAKCTGCSLETNAIDETGFCVNCVSEMAEGLKAAADTWATSMENRFEEKGVYSKYSGYVSKDARWNKDYGHGELNGYEKWKIDNGVIDADAIVSAAKKEFASYGSEVLVAESFWLDYFTFMIIDQVMEDGGVDENGCAIGIIANYAGRYHVEGWDKLMMETSTVSS